MAFNLEQFYQHNRRALIWIILLGLIWLMRDFFALIFLTFILAFIATPLTRFGERFLHLGRRLAVILVYVLYLTAVVSFVLYLTPRVKKEANTLLGSFNQTEARLNGLKRELVGKYPSLDPLITGYLRSILPDVEEKKASTEAATATAAQPAAALAAAQDVKPAAALKPAAPGERASALASQARMEKKEREEELLIGSAMKMLADKAYEKIPKLIQLLWTASATMLLALLFSFLISLDILRLSREIQSLGNSRLHDFYEQAAQPVVRFAYVVGRAFQARVVIASMNTVFTMLGLLLLGVPSVAMLSLIVFVCSFIPVLGVFISMVPLLLVALNAGGIGKTVAVVGLVTLVHLIEAFVLNPIVYGKHLKLNPVLVLMILFVGYKAFGLWGVLLGVPVAFYFIHDVFGVPVLSERVLKDHAKPPSAVASSRPEHAGRAGAATGKESAGRPGGK